MELLNKRLGAAIALCLSAVALALPGAAAAQTAQEKQEILCKHLPPEAVAPIPAPIAGWVRVICTPEGQALAPRFESPDGTAVWLRHGTRKPFAVYALPQDIVKNRAAVIETIGKDNIRFTRFKVRQLDSGNLDSINQMFDRGFPDKAELEFETVYEMITQSTFKNLIFNVFFFVEQGKPIYMVACLLKCRLAVPLDVVDLEQMRKTTK